MAKEPDAPGADQDPGADDQTLTNEYDGDGERDGIPANGTRPVKDHSPEGLEGPPPRTV